MIEAHQMMTDEELTIFAEKLTAFSNGLSPNEANLLGHILQRAAGSDDVEGYTTTSELNFYSQLYAIFHSTQANIIGSIR